MYVDRKWRLAGTLVGYAAVSWYRDNGGDGSEHALAVRECPVLRLRIPYRTHICRVSCARSEFRKEPENTGEYQSCLIVRGA